VCANNKKTQGKVKKRWLGQLFILVVLLLGGLQFANQPAKALSNFKPRCTDTLPTNWSTSLLAVITANSWATSPQQQTINLARVVWYKPAGQTYFDILVAYPTSGTTNYPSLGMNDTNIMLTGQATGGAAYNFLKVKLTLPNTWTADGRTTAVTSTTFQTIPYDCYVAIYNYDSYAGSSTSYPLPNNFFPVTPGSGSLWAGMSYDTIEAATTLVGAPHNTSNFLSWTTPLGDVLQYTLKNGSTVIYQGSLQYFDDTGLTNGTAYGYTVTADNSAGTGTVSNTLSLAPYAAGGTSSGGGITEAELIDGLKTYFTPRVKESMALAIVAFMTYIIVNQFRWRPSR
jgi:hypothetical protein